jgi:hypothetical protein
MSFYSMSFHGVVFWCDLVRLVSRVGLVWLVWLVWFLAGWAGFGFPAQSSHSGHGLKD